MSGSAIVVGAGVWGAAIASELVDRGWDVAIVEQWAPANARGSSGDRTRMLRVGYASDDVEADLWYARSALSSLTRWTALQEEEGVPLLHPVPLVWLSVADHALVHRVGDRLRAVGLEPALVPTDRLRELFPDVVLDDVGYALLEPRSAIIRATAAVEAFVARALRGGARLMLDRAEPVDEPGVVRVAGQRLTADRVIWACGSWLGRLFPDEAPITATRQDVLHWQSPPAWRDAAAWFEEGAGVYGFPDVEGLGVKAVMHVPGPVLDPDRDRRDVDPGAVEHIAGYLRRRFPSLGAAPLLWGRAMHYEMTPDAHFVIGPRPGDERSLIVGGGSGHGFKHAPTVAQHVADLLEGTTQPVPWFAPGRRETARTTR